MLLIINPGGTFVEDTPHQGEEFGFVLSGNVIVKLGNKKYKAKKGDSFYYKANCDHTIENLSKTEARIIMVATPPNF